MTAVTVISPQDNENWTSPSITTFHTLVDEPMMINSRKKHLKICAELHPWSP